MVEIMIRDILQFSIPNLCNKQTSDIENIVDQIISVKCKNPEAETSSLEAEIDQIVYDLYGLTEEEVRIIENK